MSKKSSPGDGSHGKGDKGAAFHGERTTHGVGLIRRLRMLSRTTR